MRAVLDDTQGSSDSIRVALVVIQQISSEMNKSKRDQLKRDVQKWLSPPDARKNHHIACATHHGGTATWFIQGNAFAAWELTSSRLWIHQKTGLREERLVIC
ncbi:hypothetical protein BJV78DRAFT_944872 [Lactifluus subvellereus]|nr:hypothetical protein BJV78DRAFT_944872 [Lactifluus subvellereus]